MQEGSTMPVTTFLEALLEAPLEEDVQQAVARYTASVSAAACTGACAARRACRASAAPACVRRAPAPAPAVLLLPPLVCVILCSMNTCCVHIHPPAHRAPAAPCRRRLNVGDRLLKAYVL